MSEAMQERVFSIFQAFNSATTPEEYREALKKAKRLPRQYHLQVLDALCDAADRLDLVRETGVPKKAVLEGGARKVKTRGTIEANGRTVVVETLS